MEVISSAEFVDVSLFLVNRVATVVDPITSSLVSEYRLMGGVLTRSSVKCGNDTIRPSPRLLFRLHSAKNDTGF